MDQHSSIVVFADFDGTVTRNDIGDAFLLHFGDGERCIRYYQEYLDGKLGAQECWQKEFETVRSLSPKKLSAFLKGFAMDPGFPAFVVFCEEHKIPVTIVSDGFDAYIDHILRREGMERVPYFSNRLQFREDGGIIPIFPHTDAECNDCANCKRNHLLTGSGDDQVIVYIGDGYSDRCPAGFADIVFAKNALLRHCEKENITYHRFDTFHDVLSRFRLIIAGEKPKKRRTAELARKEVFMQG
ncbi:MAG: MtnX-like HAD-IB family phosphatase [Ignavibacteriales bacterium]|nr:MtnX-like HAD-IB family phosphatase [Ignavibacteriales bacterium]